MDIQMNNHMTPDMAHTNSLSIKTGTGTRWSERLRCESNCQQQADSQGTRSDQDMGNHVWNNKRAVDTHAFHPSHHWARGFSGGLGEAIGLGRKRLPLRVATPLATWKPPRGLGNRMLGCLQTSSYRSHPLAWLPVAPMRRLPLAAHCAGERKYYTPVR